MTIICDGCRADLTTFSLIGGWRLSLQAEPVPLAHNVDEPTTVVVHRLMAFSGRHFCGWPCLYAWADARRGEG